MSAGNGARVLFLTIADTFLQYHVYLGEGSSQEPITKTEGLAMNSNDNAEKWFVERVGRSVANLMKVVCEEAKLEMMGLPLEVARAIHNRAVFELLRMVNENSRSLRESEPQYGEFMEFISHEYKLYVEMCLRMQEWNEKCNLQQTKDDTRVLFRKNASRN